MTGARGALRVRFRSRPRAWRWAGGITIAAGALVLPLGLDGTNLTTYGFMGTAVIVAVGLSLLVGFAGQISVGQGAFYALGAYVAGLLSAKAGWPPLAALAMAPLATGAIAIVVGIPLLRLQGHYLAFATLALHLIVLTLLFTWEGLTGGQNGLLGIPAFGLADGATYVVLVWSAALVTIALANNLVSSRPGRGLRAIAVGERTAAALGVSVGSYKLRLFALAGALAGLGGGLYTFLFGFLSPDAFPIILSIEFLLMVAIGGMGSTMGAAVGAVTIIALQTALEDLGTLPGMPLEAPEVMSVGVYGLVLIIVMRFAPRGVLPTVGDAMRARRMVPLDRGAACPPAPAGSDRASPLRGASPECDRAGALALSARGVTKCFGAVRAVDAVDIDVHAGSLTCLIGPNGAGKSTLLHALSGFVRLEPGGSITLGGVDVSGWPPHRRVHRGLTTVFQATSVLEHADVLTNVMLGCHSWTRAGFVAATLRAPSYRRDERSARAAALEALDLVGLAERATDPVHTLPFGLLRLLAIARALAARPRVLLLDEPVAGLRQAEKDELRRVFLGLRERGFTQVLVEHDMRFVGSVADRIVVLDRGAVIASGAPDEVRRDERVITAYLGASA